MLLAVIKKLTDWLLCVTKLLFASKNWQQYFDKHAEVFTLLLVITVQPSPIALVAISRIRL